MSHLLLLDHFKSPSYAPEQSLVLANTVEPLNIRHHWEKLVLYSEVPLVIEDVYYLGTSLVQTQRAVERKGGGCLHSPYSNGRA